MIRIHPSTKWHISYNICRPPSWRGIASSRRTTLSVVSYSTSNFLVMYHQITFFIFAENSVSTRFSIGLGKHKAGYVTQKITFSLSISSIYCTPFYDINLPHVTSPFSLSINLSPASLSCSPQSPKITPSSSPMHLACLLLPTPNFLHQQPCMSQKTLPEPAWYWRPLVHNTRIN